MYFVIYDTLTAVCILIETKCYYRASGTTCSASENLISIKTTYTEASKVVYYCHSSSGHALNNLIYLAFYLKFRFVRFAYMVI